MGKRNRNPAIKNNYLLNYYIDRLMNIAISSYKWSGLPDTVDERYLELTLLTNGDCVFFNDPAIGYLALNCAPNGGFDVYHIPVLRRAYSTASGYQYDLNNENSVIIYDNLLHVNPLQTIQLYATKLMQIDNVIDLNLNAQKTPILIKCDENEFLSLKNVYMQYEGNTPYLFATKGLNQNALQVLKTDAPYLVTQLYEYKTQTWNEALTALGIMNVSFVKRERLVSDEVTRSQGGVFAAQHTKIGARKQACDQINRMFGLNVDCEFRDYSDAYLVDTADELGNVGAYEHATEGGEE